MLRMSAFRLIVLLASAVVGFGATAAESVYTKLVFDSCVSLDSNPQGARLQCSGLGGYGVTFQEGDLRQAVQFGHVGTAGVFETFGVFNRVNDTIEWRLDDKGVPMATILRWFLEHPGDETGQVLVVSRIGQPGDAAACVVGYVDAKANSNANVMARVVADGLAGGFRCGIDQPVFHGERGPLATDPSRYWP